MKCLKVCKKQLRHIYKKEPVLNLKLLAIVGILTSVAQYSLAWEVEVGTTLGLGEDPWMAYEMNDGSIEEFYPGDSGFQFLIAKDIYSAGSVTAYVQTGYHYGSMATPVTTTLDITDSFSFIPVNAYATYQVNSNMKLGAGINFLVAPTFRGELSTYEAEYNFSGNLGFIVKFQHDFPNTENWTVGVDYFSNKINFESFSDTDGDSVTASGSEEPYSISVLSISIGYIF
jgi:hypothetical protein